MNKLFKKFGEEARWVEWEYKEIVEKNGEKKLTKRPLGKSNDPSTWSKLSSFSNLNKVGIMFGIDKKFLGIDIDHCLNKETGEIEHEEKENIISLISVANTYTEISPSGTGIHLYFDISEPLELESNKKAPYECYSSLRFFTVTGNVYGEEKEVRTITSEEAITILSTVGYPWGKIKKEKEVRSVGVPVSLGDQELLKKMFKSKNGEKLQSLYNGNIGTYGDDASTADMALCSSLAFWTGKNSDQMERIWMASPLGNREKTQNRKDYRDRTIAHAITNCDHIYEPPVSKQKVQVEINDGEFEDVDFDFLFTIKGKDHIKVITLCLENICRVLRKHPDFKGRLRLDEFKGEFEILEKGSWNEIEDATILKIQTRVSELFTEFQTVRKEMIHDAIDTVAEENRIDSAADYLRSLTWDQTSRLDQWLCHTYGVEDNIYHRAVASNWLKGLANRIIYPGCKFDYVLVLEGEQGAKKSSSFGILAGDWYVETTLTPDTKDFFLMLKGKAIVEFSEGETMSRTEVKKLKAVITTQSDKYREPYKRLSIDHPRRCVFAMTTNSDEYLKDETGNRRWLPVKTVYDLANLEWLKENRDQILAEAYYRAIVLKETTWEFPKDETLAEQAKRRTSDPNEDLIVSWYEKLNEYQKNDGVSIVDIYTSLFTGGFSLSKPITKFEQMSIASVLREVLQLEKKFLRKNGERKMRWYPKGMVESPLSEEYEKVRIEDLEF